LSHTWLPAAGRLSSVACRRSGWLAHGLPAL